jgi:hypothetical protein
MPVKLAVPAVALLLAAVAPALAQNCGNPCEDGYVWTDKDMGKCIPAPPPPPPKAS